MTFREFCGSELNDFDNFLTTGINASVCLQNTFLRWIPLAYFFTVGPIWLYCLHVKYQKLDNQIKKHFNYSLCFYFKLVILVALAGFECLRIIIIVNEKHKSLSVEFANSLLLIASYILCVFILVLEKRNQHTFSVLIVTHWLLTITFWAFIFDANIKSTPKGEEEKSVIFALSFFLVVLSLLLEFYPDRSRDQQSHTDKKYPLSISSFASWISFWWIGKLIFKGYKGELSKADMWDLDQTENSKLLSEELEKAWNNALRQSHVNQSNKITSIEMETIDDDLRGIKAGNKAELKYENAPSLFWILFRLHSKEIIGGLLLKFLCDILIASGPVLVNVLLQFIENNDSEFEPGLLLVMALFMTIMLENVLFHQQQRMCLAAGIRMRSSLINLIYKKSLRLSTQARRTATTGEIVNLMQVNTQVFYDFMANVQMASSIPVQLIFSVTLLYWFMGAAVFASIGTILCLVPCLVLLTNALERTESSKLKLKDSRLKLINEVLIGIKVLKLYAWETSFTKLINDIRNIEMKTLTKFSRLYGVGAFSWNFSSFMIQVATFTTFLYINGGTNVLSANIAFVSLALFNMIRLPLYSSSVFATFAVQTKVALKRITEFLILPELDTDQIEHSPSTGLSVSLHSVNLNWTNDPSDITLKNINLKVKTGKLVAIVGKVGSGKSSFLSAILGEMNKLTGHINISGSLSYTPQQAWIQNATIRDNILFGKKFEPNFYDKVISSCALVADLTIVTGGDQIEIGEKGINLSGGQKQRVSLARAAYSDADIYLLDDPLSAVDAHVGKQIFELVIGPNGMLKDKTRIFATNSLSVLPEVDEIVLLENGSIVAHGSYQDLTANSEKFTKFVSNYFYNSSNDKGVSESKKSKIKSRNGSKRVEDLIESEDEEESTFKIIKKEQIAVGNVKFKNLIDYFRASGYVLIALNFCTSLLHHCVNAGNNFWLSDWSNNAQKEQGDPEKKTERILVYLGIGLLASGFSFVNDLFLTPKMILNSSVNLHETMLHSILRSKMSFFESTPVGRILNRFSKDVNSVEQDLPRSYTEFLFCGLDVFMIVVVISISTPYVLIAFIPLAIFYAFIQRLYVASCSQLKRLDSASRSPIYSHFGESLNGISTIRAYQAEKRFIQLIEQKVDLNSQFAYPNVACQLWLGLRLQTIGGLVVLCAAVFALIAKDTISPGIAGISLSYALNMSLMLNVLVMETAEFESNITSVERIKEYCSTELHEAEWTLNNNNNTNNNPKNSADVEWPSQGEIRFANYSLRYREDLEYVLKNIDCTVKGKEKVGIVGRTGAGKSSLVLGMFRILEIQDGDILIDGVSIKEVGLHDLRQKLTVIPQDPVLFSGSLRINLDPLEVYSDRDIWNALEKANLKKFVEELDDRLMYECSEGGDNLSVGQRQLICMTRALLRNSKIILLDEATASIDHITDELIQKTIRENFKECTILTIAHRLNTVIDSDRIMVLDKGEIVEFDTPDRLLADTSGLFYSLYYSNGMSSNASIN